ncbi:LysE family translocator [Cytobacillus horneckiae]|uniref:Lysine transporter LysE n=1 Tax=Cytobacillus horneckiae TaxID=549687 RepID=A0A2N0ZJD7_9BACI|nr:LysE family transporter [Cytobacillus horneckiae]MEC1153975.1 LysE family transporter [Cytobacillus horneckiae]MED2938550.1 LysE family transporter [Cytobacillus horneckiae]PKG29601.1 lysine transporter LysE [Cytobacillus horneckiae]
MNILSFVVYCLIVTVTPGPTNIIILSYVQNYGVKAAMLFTYGSTIGFGVLLASSAVLNSLFINLIPNILIYMQILGSIYMLFLAYQVYKMDVSKKTDSSHTVSFSFGVISQFLNPKVVIFTLTVFPSFVLPYYNSTFALTIGVIGITIIGFIAFLLWVGFGAIFKELLRKYNKMTNVVMASCLIYAAVMIWF